jgi:phage head maturation protease
MQPRIGETAEHYARRLKRKARHKRSKMILTLDNLLESIRTRTSVGGIGVAASHFRGLAKSIAAGSCPSGIAVNLWEKELAEAESRLTYCDDAMREIKAIDSASVEHTLRQKSADGTIEKTGAILVYDCVLSSCSKDRDGDVIDQKGGLEVDANMPLLWQHIQISPIGKHIGVLSQDETFTKSRFAIADTALGRDAATLVKFGALRKSIGFKPFDFIPREIVKGADGRDVVRGWHIKKSGCMEGSLVSIPANPDANILNAWAKEFDGLATAFSRGELKDGMVKHWAKGYYDLRPAQAPGVTLETKAATPPATKADEPLPADSSGMNPDKIEKCPDCSGTIDAQGKCTKCSWHRPQNEPTKGGADLLTKMDEASGLKYYSSGTNPHPVGSFEAVQYELNRTAASHMRGKGVPYSTDGYCHMLATFTDSAIICVEPYASNQRAKCYRVGWSTKDGVAAWDGEATEVKLETSVVEKAIAARVEHASPAAIAKSLIAKSCYCPEASKAVDAVAQHAEALKPNIAADLAGLLL